MEGLYGNLWSRIEKNLEGGVGCANLSQILRLDGHNSSPFMFRNPKPKGNGSAAITGKSIRHPYAPYSIHRHLLVVWPPNTTVVSPIADEIKDIAVTVLSYQENRQGP